jgi:hypothetical protein
MALTAKISDCSRFMAWITLTAKKRLRMRNRLKRKKCACATSFYIPQAKKQMF